MTATSAKSGLRDPEASPLRDRTQVKTLSEDIEVVKLFGESVQKNVGDRKHGHSVNCNFL